MVKKFEQVHGKIKNLNGETTDNIITVTGSGDYVKNANGMGTGQGGYLTVKVGGATRYINLYTGTADVSGKPLYG